MSDLFKHMAQTQKADTEQATKPFTTLSDKSNETSFVISVGKKEYLVEYAQRFSALKDQEGNIIYFTIMTNNLSLLLKLHNFAPELYQEFRLSYRTQKLDMVNCYTGEITGEMNHPFITVEESQVVPEINKE